MEKNTVSLPLKLSVVISFIFMLTANGLSALLPLNGMTPGEISDSYPNLFAPAGITFSVWSLIYLLLLLHTLYYIGLLGGKGPCRDEGLLRKTGIAFVISSLLNAAWIFSWHYQMIPLSMVLMGSLLLSLMGIQRMMEGKEWTTRERILVRLPFTVYFGWITVATIANATVLLVSLGWKGFGLTESVWTIAVLAVGALIGMAVVIRIRSRAYGLVFIWAYAGILWKHLSAAGFSGQYPGIIAALIVCLSLMGVVMALGGGKR